MTARFHTETHKPRAKRSGRFTMKKLEVITVTTAPNYLVKGIIPKTGIVVVWGPPKCGKSFWTFDLVMHIVLGRAYRGHRVQQGAVVYLALEGGHGFRARVEAWRRKRLNGHAERGVPFYLIDEPVDLVADCAALIAAIREQLGATVPSALVVDTLNRALIGDENKSDDMARFIRAVDMIRVAFGCAVIVIHHCGVAGSRPRGHSSLTGADDAAIAIERSNDSGIISIKIEHLKDGETAAPMACKLDRVDLGVDDDGDTITSCVVEPVEGDSGPKRQSGTLMSDNDRLALDALKRALVDKSERPPASNHIPQGGTFRVCPVEVWRGYFYAVKDGDRDIQRKAFLRARERLQVQGFIGTWQDYAWLAGHAGHAGTSAGHVPSDKGGTDTGDIFKDVPDVPPSRSRSSGSDNA
jgi:AAA domain